MIWLYVQEKWWNHGDSLLSCDSPGRVLLLQQLVHLCQSLQLSELGAGVCQLPGQLLGIPWQRPWRKKTLTIYLRSCCVQYT